MSFADVERLTKMVPNVLNITLSDAMKTEPGFGELERKDPRVAEILQVALRWKAWRATVPCMPPA